MQETTYSRWLISDMYYPSESIEGPIKSHEAICVLNTNDQDAGLTITLYFEDREPMQLAPQRCPARRNVHIPWMRPEPRTAPVYRWIRRMPLSSNRRSRSPCSIPAPMPDSARWGS